MEGAAARGPERAALPGAAAHARARVRRAKRRGRPWRTTRPDPQAHRRPDPGGARLHRRPPDELWVADLSYLRCWEGVVFFAFVIDAYSRRIVGWQLASHMRTTLVLDALHGARPASPQR